MLSDENIRNEFEELKQSIINEIKILIKSQSAKPENSKVKMSAKEARIFISNRGIPMSISRLRKLTMLKSKSDIPFYRTGNRLVFDSEELEVWCENQLKRNNEPYDPMPLIRSAQKKLLK